MNPDFYKGFKYINDEFTPALKIWHNGLAIKADTWKSCTNFCTYCYARATSYGMQVAMRVAPDLKLGRGMNVKKVLNIFEDAYKKTGRNPYLEWCIRTKRYIELGTIGETFQEADEKYRVSWNFLEIADKYHIPLYINTKGNLLCHNKEYFNKIANYSAPVIICLTITTVDDKLSKKIEPNAPSASERLELIRRLKAVGIPTVVYTAPFLKDITDAPLEDYMEKIIEAGAVGLHLRTFYMVAKTQQNPFWRKYYLKNKEYFKGCEWKKEYMIGVVQRMKKIVGDRKFYIVGVKKRWFDSEPYHGKIAFDYLPEKFRTPLLDFNLIPILRKIRQNKTKPQLLTWNNIGYKQDKIDYPEFVKSQENGGFAHICTTCSCGKNFMKLYKMDGWKWVKGGLWSGWDLKTKPEGDISKISGIYPVLEDGKYKLEDKNDPQSFVYAYIPKELKEEYVKDNCVDSTKTKDFLIPTRAGGRRINFMKSMNLIGYDLDGVLCGNSPKRKKPFFKQTGAERKEYQEERLIHFKNVEVKLRPTEKFIIITARKLKEKVVTMEWLDKNNIKPKEVYFFEGTKTRENIIKYKADVINKNKLKKYYDDDEKICKKLTKLCPTTIINVKGG